MNKFLVAALLVISFTLGLGAGYTLTPEYAVMNTDLSVMEPLGNADRFIDRRYINNLASHHLAAIDLAKQALKESHREEVRTLAEKIIQNDEAGIRELMSWKSSWYKDNRPVNKFESVNLGTNDGRFDLRFINALIAHHDSAIMTAEEISRKSNRNEILNLADSQSASLMEDKVLLEKWRSAWYGI